MKKTYYAPVALENAVSYYKEHGKLNGPIVWSILGPCPDYSDSPDPDTLFLINDEVNDYRKKVKELEDHIKALIAGEG